MSKKSLFSAGLLAALISAISVLMLIRKDCGSQQETSAEAKITVKDSEATNIMHDFLKEFVAILRKAKSDYPVPYVREQLDEILSGFDKRKVVFAAIASAKSKERHIYARLEYTKNGFPLIELYILPIAKYIKELADYMDSRNKCQNIDALLTDWFVALAIHEWTHHKLRHSGDEYLPMAQHLRQESEAWANVLGNVVEPAMRHGRFATIIGDEYPYGLACYRAAKKNTADPLWQAFVYWIAADGPDDELANCFPP